MITTFDQYIEGVLESESTEQRGWRSEIPIKLYRVNHALTGLVTEIAEIYDAVAEIYEAADFVDVDWVNVKEEFGDAWWYAAVLCDALGHKIDIATTGDVPAPASSTTACNDIQYGAMQLTRCVGDSFDVIKRRIYYFAEELEDDHEKKAKALWEKIRVRDICTTLAYMVYWAGFDVRDVWTTNLLKLIGPNGRYAGKFDPDKALHRDLVAEREVLEGGEEAAK